jgi:hypothetical protein
MLEDFTSVWTWSEMPRKKKMQHGSMLKAEAGEGKASAQEGNNDNGCWLRWCRLFSLVFFPTIIIVVHHPNKCNFFG